MSDYSLVAQVIFETYEAMDKNPSITKQGVLSIITSKLGMRFAAADPEFSERDFYVEAATGRPARKEN